MESGSELTQIVDEYKKIRSQNYKKGLVYIKKKCSYAKGTMSTEDCACLEYYLSEALLYSNQGKAAMQVALGVIKDLYNVKPCRPELVLAYNVVGSNSIYLNPMVAMENFMNALEIIEENNLDEMAGLLYNNIGCMYMAVKDTKRAMPYLKKAWRSITTSHHRYSERGFYFLYNLTLGYYYLDDRDKFIKYFRLLDKLMKRSSSDRTETLFIWIRICANCYACNMTAAEADIKEILVRIQADEVSPDIIYDCISFVNGWIDYKYYDYALEALDYLEASSSKNSFYAAQKETIGLRIEINKLLGNQEKVISEVLRYYNISQKTDKENNETLARSYDARIQIKDMMDKQMQAQQETKRMKERSEMDSLTGLYNRYAMDDLFEDKFNNAIISNNPVGVGIIDIDYFKQYNDTYGHLAGDECLKRIAGLLTELMDEDILAMRYGGDEFVVLFFNKTGQEIADKAEMLNLNLKKSRIEHKGSFASEKIVSVTQGIFIEVPEENQTIYDFVRFADLALYEGKTDRGNIIYYKKRE